MSETRIIGCTCHNKAQDKINGPGRRVHNETKSGQFRCTVCKDVKGVAKGLIDKSR